jgi:antitoxin component YwqK of YwqJK toxin-antitoxin module
MIQGIRISRTTIFVAAVAALIQTGCSRPTTEEVAKVSYYHAYGPEVAETAWKEQGSSGEVVELMRNGVEFRKEYKNGVLHGTSSWSFPYSKVVARFEVYENGSKVSAGKNYETGVPQFQEEWTPNQHRIVHAWYDDGVPRLIEEYTGNTLASAQYFTLDGDVEATVVSGTGVRVERSRLGVLMSRDQLAGGEVVSQESYYPNGYLKESVVYQDGVRNGLTRRYGERGEPLVVEQWKQGVLDGPMLMFEGGNLVRQVPYACGKKNGVELRYRPGTDEVVEEVTWRQDVRHGVSKTFLQGQTIVEWYWKNGRVSEDQFLSRSETALASSQR